MGSEWLSDLLEHTQLVNGRPMIKLDRYANFKVCLHWISCGTPLHNAMSSWNIKCFFLSFRRRCLQESAAARWGGGGWIWQVALQQNLFWGSLERLLSFRQPWLPWGRVVGPLCGLSEAASPNNNTMYLIIVVKMRKFSDIETYGRKQWHHQLYHSPVSFAIQHL